MVHTGASNVNIRKISARKILQHVPKIPDLRSGIFGTCSKIYCLPVFPKIFEHLKISTELRREVDSAAEL